MIDTVYIETVTFVCEIMFVGESSCTYLLMFNGTGDCGGDKLTTACAFMND